MSYENDPRHINRILEDRARRAAELADNPRPSASRMAGQIMRSIETGMKENDAADMRAAGFPESVIESWNATPSGGAA